MAFCGGGNIDLSKIRKGPWQVEATTQKYKSAWVEVTEDKVIQPNGKAGSFATVKLKPGVSVLAIGDDDQVYLTSEYRYAIEQKSIEVVSGAVDADETPEMAAKRELREELGIEAEDWVDLGTVDPLTSILHSPARLFLAKELSFFEPQTEDSEIIELVQMKLNEAVQMVMDSKITHGPSCVLILKANHFLKKK
jgi:8-oxo-dGTP pyrophosphatase MutT (NUDIX family)